MFTLKKSSSSFQVFERLIKFRKQPERAELKAQCAAVCVSENQLTSDGVPELFLPFQDKCSLPFLYQQAA